MISSFYSIGEYINDDTSKLHFPLHSHKQHEIFLFVKGDADFIVGNKKYSLEPGDVIISRAGEMHHIIHNSTCSYHRFVLMLAPEFFSRYHCEEYESFFLPSCNSNNKLAAKIVHSSGLYDTFFRYKKYSEEYIMDSGSPILIAIVTEMLYLINKISGISTTNIKNSLIKSVINYLNANYTGDISLDELAGNFYLSKNYLCRVFRKFTGITIHEYICRKRLTLVKELTAEGSTISDAAMAAGFGDYSCFYRAYVKEYGKSPRKNLF
ncbi:MAG: AraC family transcriptional regulator [Lachnospiraceae bacterium]|nr:AraC family transcriptional regulator [Lachnospiraceae bacterium]